MVWLGLDRTILPVEGAYVVAKYSLSDAEFININMCKYYSHSQCVCAYWFQ